MAITCNVNLQTAITNSKTANPNTAVKPPNLQASQTAYSGKATLDFDVNLSASQVAFAFHDSRSNSGETLNLTDSSLKDPYGNPFIPSLLKVIHVANTSTNAFNLGGGSLPVLPNAIPIAAGGSLVLCVPSGITVNASLANLKIDSGGLPVTYDVALSGA